MFHYSLVALIGQWNSIIYFKMDDGYDAEVKKLEEELQGRAIILPTTPLKAFKRFCQDYT